MDVTYGKGDFWQKNIDSAYKGTLEVDSKGGDLVVINRLDMETYLYGVIAAEIPASSPMEALKAQAVAARTIAVKNMGRHKKDGFDFCNGTHCQVYRGVTVETPRTVRAVDETKGEIIVHENRPIEAFYHANCGGCLRADVFERRPYLFSDKFFGKEEKAVRSPWFEEGWLKNNWESYCGSVGRDNVRWQRVYDIEDFEMTFGFPIRELERILPVKKGDCGHFVEIEVIREGVKRRIKGGLNIRTFFDKLKSSVFRMEIKYRKEKEKAVADTLFIWGGGFGHGVGLCQEGAVNRAQKGDDYKKILKRYYKDIEIKNIY